MKYENIGILGATGVLGQELINVINDRDIKTKGVRLFATKDSVGEVYQIGISEIVVEESNLKALADCGCVVLASQSEEVKKLAEALSEKNVPIIDMTGTNRQKTKSLVSVNSTAIILSKVLKPLNEFSKIKRVTASLYQSVSSAGKTALDELWSQTLAVFNQREVESEAFHQQIAFNCIPQIDVILGNGFSREEESISEDIKLLLNDETIRCSITAVRVPVFYGTAISINVEQTKQVFPDDLIKNLSENTDLMIYPDSSDYPMHMSVAGSNEVHVGRIRKDPSVDAGLVLWVAADNIRQQVLYALQFLE